MFQDVVKNQVILPNIWKNFRPASIPKMISLTIFLPLPITFLPYTILIISWYAIQALVYTKWSWQMGYLFGFLLIRSNSRAFPQIFSNYFVISCSFSYIKLFSLLYTSSHKVFYKMSWTKVPSIDQGYVLRKMHFLASTFFKVCSLRSRDKYIFYCFRCLPDKSDLEMGTLVVYKHWWCNG